MSAINQIVASLKASASGSIAVSGAGTSAADGTYTLTGTHNSKNYYNKSGTSATAYSISWIFYAAIQWRWIIHSDAGLAYYYSTSDVATPDLATGWIAQAGSNPVPTVAAA